jgi:riboflavin synthase
MFTGLVEAKGSLVRRIDRGGEARLVIQGDLVENRDPLALGESIAIDGVCLTVDKIVQARGPSIFEVDASTETLSRTTLGTLAAGAAVNLERALALGARLGGHIVSGHVDGVGRVTSVTPLGTALTVTFEAPADLARFIATKGSICVNGVSLTVNRVSVPPRSTFDVMLIPHTREKTTLDAVRPGTPVNLEVDLLARYVARLLSAANTPNATDTIDDEKSKDEHLLDRLRASGYL